MKTLGWLMFFVAFILPAQAGTSGTLFLKAHVPAQTRVTIDPVRGTFHLHSNLGRYALTTWVSEGRDARGFRIITIIPQ